MPNGEESWRKMFPPSVQKAFDSPSNRALVDHMNEHMTHYKTAAEAAQAIVSAHQAMTSGGKKGKVGKGNLGQ